MVSLLHTTIAMRESYNLASLGCTQADMCTKTRTRTHNTHMYRHVDIHKTHTG
jgi:hypothetical protein